jgi:hypothetical protein
MDVRERENALVDALNMGGKCDTRHGISFSGDG